MPPTTDSSTIEKGPLPGTSPEPPPYYGGEDAVHDSKFEKPGGLARNFEETDDAGDSVRYIRDPKKLVAYLIPFPTPHHTKAPASAVPTRFLIYTPPAPPLYKPTDGEKEGILHKTQRKWQEEVKSAKTTTAPTKSVKGMRYKLTRGVNKAMIWTTTSNIDFVGRMTPTPAKDRDDAKSGAATPDTETDPAIETPPEHDGDSKSKFKSKKPKAPKVAIEEIIFVYPPSMNLTPEEMRAEFINSMLRTKSKAQRDTIISTGLLPIAWGIDIIAVGVGGLGEVATFWTYISFMGLKNSRSVTNRLKATEEAEKEKVQPQSDDASTDIESEKPSSSSTSDREKAKDDETKSQPQLALKFNPSPSLELLRAYMDAECRKVDNKLFLNEEEPPEESDVLDAIGWSPEYFEGPRREEDEERWEAEEVRDDMRQMMHKGAKEWRSWCRSYEKGPEKVLKKAETGKK
jgi:hypothetical protein